MVHSVGSLRLVQRGLATNLYTLYVLSGASQLAERAGFEPAGLKETTRS